MGPTGMFEPITPGGVTLKNRVVASSHAALLVNFLGDAYASRRIAFAAPRGHEPGKLL